jgi:hypothetical protein
MTLATPPWQPCIDFHCTIDGDVPTLAGRDCLHASAGRKRFGEASCLLIASQMTLLRLHHPGSYQRLPNVHRAIVDEVTTL